jgi:hypothetical protein
MHGKKMDGTHTAREENQFFILFYKKKGYLQETD